MSAFTRVFDPLDLEIIDRVYEAAWAQIEAREPSRDKQKDGEREALRKWIFAVVGSGHVDFDDLCDKVLASIPAPDTGVTAPVPQADVGAEIT